MATSVFAADLDRSALVKFSENAQKFYERSRKGMVQDVQVEREAFGLHSMARVLLQEWDGPSAANKRAQVQAIILYLRPQFDSLSAALGRAQNGWDLEGDLKMLGTFVDLIERAEVSEEILSAPAVVPARSGPKLLGAQSFSVRSSWGASFVTVFAGTFTMGSPTWESGRSDDETPHQVTITRSFEIQTTEVTQAQWKAVMGERNNPSYFIGDDLPVGDVSWEDVQRFIVSLNALDPAYTYRLPTEAEWEYAARGGTKTAFSFGDDPALLKDYTSYSANVGSQPHLVGQKNPNAYGLYDMHGNVREWVSDWYGDYPQQMVADPQGPSTGSRRVVRGGSGASSPWWCMRSAQRYSVLSVGRTIDVGFRLVRTARKP